MTGGGVASALSSRLARGNPITPMSDVYCFGHVSSGVIVRIKGSYPQPDGYAEIAELLENHCGEATGTALVLAKLGVSVSLEGNWIGDTPACRKTLEFLRSRKIDCSGLGVKPGYQGVNEIVISDAHSRTVFGRYIDLLFTTPQWNMPSASRIGAARFVCVDPAFGEATLFAAREARARNKPVVTCDTRPDSPLAALAEAVIVSGEFIAREYPEALKDGPARIALFRRYQETCPGLVVFTAGSRPLLCGRGKNAAEGPGLLPRGEIHTLAPYKTKTVDTAGAGDSFRGGLVYGMMRAASDLDSLRFACSVAALVCTTAPGCVNPPSLAEVEALLAGGEGGETSRLAVASL